MDIGATCHGLPSPSPLICLGGQNNADGWGKGYCVPPLPSRNNNIYPSAFRRYFCDLSRAKENLSVSPACFIFLLEMRELTLPFFCVPGLDIPLAAVGH